MHVSHQYIKRDWFLYHVKLLFAENKFLNALGIKGPTERAIYSAMKEWEEKNLHQICAQDYSKKLRGVFLGWYVNNFEKCSTVYNLKISWMNNIDKYIHTQWSW